MDFDQLIRFGVEQGASDVHLQTGAAPLLRINGQIRTVEAPAGRRVRSCASSSSQSSEG